MNFDEAISAHVEWKVRLRVHLAEPGQKTLTPEEVASDDRCVLGRWIYGEGAGYASDGAYQKLVEEHRAFHRLAADIVRAANEGRASQAQDSLEGAFQQRSLAVVNAINAIKRHSLHAPRQRV